MKKLAILFLFVILSACAPAPDLEREYPEPIAEKITENIIQEIPDEITLELKKFEYNPKSIQMRPNTIVTIINKDVNTHLVTSADLGLRILLKPGESFTHQFNGVGDYDIVDSFNGRFTFEVRLLS